MALRALAVFRGLMQDLRLFKEIVIAGEAYLPLSPFHFHGESRFVTLAALVVLVRRVSDEFWFWRTGSTDELHRLAIERTPIFIVLNFRRISPRSARTGDAVKKEGQPLLLLFRCAAGQHSHGTEKTEQGWNQVTKLRYAASPTASMRVGVFSGMIHLAWWRPVMICSRPFILS